MKYTLAELKGRATLSTGQADDLKIDNGNTRVWLSRCGVADGAECDNMVSIEERINGRWEETETYEAK